MFISNNKPDLGAFTPASCGNKFGVLALDLCQHMVVGIVLLMTVFVGVDTELVVEERGVLPLRVGLECQQLHKVVDFRLVKLAAKFFVHSKDSVVFFVSLDNVPRWPLTLV